MEHGDHMVPRLRELLKERGVRGYSRKRKAELIEMLRASDSRPPGLSKPQPPPQLHTWEPMTLQCTIPPPPPPSMQNPQDVSPAAHQPSGAATAIS